MSAFRSGVGIERSRYPNVPLILDLAGGVDEAGHGRAIERGREADALDAGGGEIGDGERAPLDADHEVERPLEAGADLLDCREIRQARRKQHVGAGFLVGLEAPDGVGEIGIAADEVFRPRREQEFCRQRAGRSDGGLDTAKGVVGVVDGLFRFAGRVLDRPADETDGGGVADCHRGILGRIAEAVL